MEQKAAAEPAVTFERLGPHVALVTLNRPAARNTVNSAVAGAFATAVKAAEEDPNLRVAILAASSGPVFCAGADLTEVAAGGGRKLSTENGGFAAFVKAPRTKPWIAAVNGAAIGGG